MARSAILFAVIVASAVAVPAAPRPTCATKCSAAGVFTHEAGKSYVYEYSLDTSTALLGTVNEFARLHATAHVHIDFISPCEYGMWLTDVNLEESSHAPDFAAALMEHPVRFSFQDGIVENVCSEASEAIWVLNIKRGILSTFQTTVTQTGTENLKETDISGVCDTHYTTTAEGDAIHINKVKDLTSCMDRPDLYSRIFSVQYMADAPLQRLPLLMSKNKCHQKVEGGLMLVAECEDTHKFRPFSTDEGGAVTIVKTTLTLVSLDQPPAPVAETPLYPHTLVFEEETQFTYEKNMEAIIALLSELEAASQGEIRPEVPVLFSKLVTALKGLSYPELTEVYSNAQEMHSHKFLVDAMPLVGTGAAAEVVKDLYLSHEISQEEGDLYFTSLAFIKNPKADMFTALAPLLENSPSQKALLGISALINNYCKIHHDCIADPGIQQIIQLIEAQLGAGCRSISVAEKHKVLVALKALGNAGRFVNGNDILHQCYIEDNDMEVRVAAIEAYRHTPCEYDHSNLLAVFEDVTQDSEVRIAAYLALFNCRTPELILKIKEHLISEGINQVVSFIYSHLTSIQESAAPGKQAFHNIIEDEVLQKKYSAEALKYSHNYESSIFTNELNIGAEVESNIIFSSKSYLPRSAMLNLTLDLFGESINFFEIGGRIENFESYIEHFFGPSGYFPEEHIQGILANLRRNSHADATSLEKYLGKVIDQPQGSYFLRVFGNELHYKHFHGVGDILSEAAISNPLELLMDIIRKGSADYTKSYELLHVDYTVPTVSGLPLILHTKGTATLGLQVTGNFHVQSLMNIDVEGHIHPSAAVNMESLLVTDAHVTRTGLKVSSTLHSSTFLDGKLKVEQGKAVDLVLNTPKENVEVIDVHTEFFYVHDNVEVKKEPATQEIHEGCVGEYLGTALCGELKFTPASDNGPLFPLSGPAGAHVFLKKTDTQTGYVAHLSYENSKLAITVDTPGSTEAHKIGLTAIFVENSIDIDLVSPLATVQGALQYTWKRELKAARAEMVLDGAHLYKMEASLKTTDVEGDIKIVPTLVVTLPGDIVVLNAHGTVDSHIEYEEYMFSVQPKDYLITSMAEIEYLVSDTPYVIKHSGKLAREIADSISTYILHCDLTPSQLPELALNLDGKAVIAPENYQAQASASIGTMTLVVDKSLDISGGKINGVLDATFTSAVNNVHANIGIHGDMEKASVDVKTTINGQDYAMKVEGSRSSILVDINVIKHIVLDAHVILTPELKKLHLSAEVDKEINPTNVLALEGLLSTAEMKVDVKYFDMEASLSGKILDNDIEIEAMYAPDKRVFANIHYTLGETKSLAITVETPLEGWEKQDAMFSLSLLEREINGRFAATWKNAEQLALTINGKLLPGLLHNEIYANIAFSSSFIILERASLLVDHKLAEGVLHTLVEGHYNTHEVKGTLELALVDTGISGDATFSSPFTENVLMHLEHKLQEKDLSTILEVKYGDQVSTVTLKGHMDLQDVTLVLSAVSPKIPEVSANLQYKLLPEKLDLVMEAHIGEDKIMLNIGGEKAVSEESTTITGHLRLITPKYEPLTATLAHTHDGHKFNSEFEMTRVFWSSFGSLKFHADGHLLSADDIALTANLITPETKGSILLAHKVAEKAMTSSLDISLNDEKIIVSASGMLDAANIIASLDLHVASTLSNIDDTDLKFETTRSENTQQSKATLTKGAVSLIIDHSLTYIDKFNWENTLDVNNKYLLHNKQSLVDSTYSHEIEFKFDEKHVHVTGIVTPQFSPDTNKIDVSLVIDSFWTETVSVAIHHTNIGEEITQSLVLEYQPGQKIEIVNKMKISTDSLHLEMSLMTPLWQPLGLKVDIQPMKAFTLALTHGDCMNSIGINGSIEPMMMHGHMEVISCYLPFPIMLEASYDISSPEKKAHLLLTADKKYEVLGSISGHLNEAKLHINIELPFESLHNIEFNGEYHVQEPLSALIELKLNSVPYSLQLSTDLAKVDEKMVSLVLTYGEKVINLTGKLERGETVYIKVDTPIPNWEHLEASFFKSKTTIICYVSRNEQKIELTGTLHLRPDKGKVNLTFQTPFEGLETLIVVAHYNFQGLTKIIDINSKLADKELSLKAEIKIEDPLVPAITLSIVTPFEAITTIGGEAHLDLKNPVKIAEVKVYHNDEHYDLLLQVTAETPLKGHAVSKITTPLAGWTDVKLDVSYDFTGVELYKVQLIFEKEGDVKTLEGHLSINENAIIGEIMTPIIGYEKLSVNINYVMEGQQLSANAELLLGANQYEIHGNVVFDIMKPKVTIQIKTPIPEAANVELVFDADVASTKKSMHIIFKLNESIYSVDYTSEWLHNLVYVKGVVKSPISGYTSYDFETTLDFTSDIKTADLTLISEGDAIVLTFSGRLNNNNFHMEVQTPIEGLKSMKMLGDYTEKDGEHDLYTIFDKENERYSFSTHISMNTKTATVELITPIEQIQKVLVQLQMRLLDNGLEILLHAERNADKVHLHMLGLITPLKSEISVTVETPIEGWMKLGLRIHYDLASEKKMVEMSIEKDSLVKKVAIEASYSLTSGSLKLITPIPGFEDLGADYVLNIAESNDKLDAGIKLHYNAREWNLEVHAQYTPESIAVKFVTPIEGFHTLGLEAHYKWSAEEKAVSLKVIHNEVTYELGFHFALSGTMLAVNIKAGTPIPEIANVLLDVKIDWNNMSELVSISGTLNDQAMSLLISAHADDVTASLTVQLTSPITGWTHAIFSAKADFTPDLISLDVSLERDEGIKPIVIIGQLTGANQYFNLNTPYVTLRSVIIRSKRSLEIVLNEGTDYALQLRGGFKEEDTKLSLQLEAILFGKKYTLDSLYHSEGITYTEGLLVLHTPGIKNIGGSFSLALQDNRLMADASLMLPFHQVSKIILDVDVDLDAKIKGHSKLTIGHEIFSLDIDLVGASLAEGYQGSLEIHTPFHALSNVQISGSLKGTFLALETDLKIVGVSASHEVVLGYEISEPKVSIHATIKSSLLVNELNIAVALEGFGTDHLLANIAVNDIKIFIEAKYPSLESLEGTLQLTLIEETHILHGALAVAADRVKGGIQIVSSLFDGERKLDFDVSIPELAFNKVTVDLTLVLAEPHHVHFDLDVQNKVHIMVKLGTPYLPQLLSVTLDIDVASAGLIVQTPEAVHTANVQWRLTYKLPADTIISLQLSSPLLEKDIGLGLIVTGDTSNLALKTELRLGDVIQVVEVRTSITETNGHVVLSSETSMFGKASFEASLSFAEKIDLHITVEFKGDIHVIDIVYDKESQHLIAEAKSALIPQGMARAEVTLTGELKKNMKLTLAFTFAEKTVSANLIIKIRSSDHIIMNLKIVTPFQGYKKMTFGARYIKEEITRISFFIDKPISLNADLYVGMKDDEVNADLKLETNIEKFEDMEAKIKIPLKEFAPHVSAAVIVDGASYSGLLGLRAKAPYELGLRYHVAELYSGGFHLRTDSLLPLM